MGTQRHVVIVPGLSDDPRGLAWLTRDWATRHGLIPHIVRFGWHGDSSDFAPRLRRLGTYIDRLVADGKRVSLLGTSAGASAALNAYFPRTTAVGGLVSVCGRLRAGASAFPSLDHSRGRPLFKPSVLHCEAGLRALGAADRGKILTVRPLYDEFVPVATMTVAGATNRRILAVEHLASIYLALSVYSNPVVDFLLAAP